MPDRKDAEPGFDSERIVELTADIVSAYVSNNTISHEQVPELIAGVSGALREKISGPADEEPEPQKPAVPVRRSVTPDAVICLECAKKAKSLKRHIRTAHGMTPEEYRAKWGLSREHPIVAPSYAERRSQLAKSLGFGQKRQATGGGATGGKRRPRQAKAAEEKAGGS